jgi:hypothetical protein
VTYSVTAHPRQPRRFQPPTTYRPIRFNPKDRRTCIGGSDARIIMGDDEASLIRLWQEKRGEVKP